MLAIITFQGDASITSRLKTISLQIVLFNTYLIPSRESKEIKNRHPLAVSAIGAILVYIRLKVIYPESSGVCLSKVRLRAAPHRIVDDLKTVHVS